MRNDVHFAALRASAAAAKIALATTVVGGCGGATAAPPEGPPSDEVNSVPPRNEQEPPRSGAASGQRPDASAPTDSGADSAAPDCPKLITEASGGSSDWPEGEVKASAEVKACCLEAVKSSAQNGERIKEHWWCCAAIDWGRDTELGGACTPWGPPVPPAMRRREALFEQVA